MKKPILIITLLVCAAVLCAVLPITAAAFDDSVRGAPPEAPVIEPGPSVEPSGESNVSPMEGAQIESGLAQPVAKVEDTVQEAAMESADEIITDDTISASLEVVADEKVVDGQVVGALAVEEIEGPLISIAKVEGPQPYTMEWAERYAPGSVAPFEEQVGDNGDYDEITSYPPNDTYRITVDYNNQCVYAYSKDENGNYTVLERVMICTTGGNGNWTPTGEFSMGSDSHRFGFFPSYNCYAQYWTQMFGSFYFHSLLYNARDASTYTMSSYNNLGSAVSHGCVRLFVPDARWIFENCAPGTWGEVTTRFEKDPELKNVLRNGYEGCIDYVEGETVI